MKLDLELQVISEPTLEVSTQVVSASHSPVPAFQPAFVETFQQIIDSLPEQIALLDDSWTILVVNPAWMKTAAYYGFDGVLPGCNYVQFCETKAGEGNAPARIAVDGIREMEKSGETSFRFTYNGREKWAGRAFQLCVNRLEIDGRRFATVTRDDVTELVHLRLMREEFSHSLIEHQADERRRIAREIHDSTMQLLAGLGLSLGQLKHSKHSKRSRATGDIVSEMEGLLGEAQRELRAISFLAHPPMVSDLGLTQALRQLTAGFARRTGLNIAINAEAEVTISPAAQMAVFRMVQEALSNVHRHARATDVAVGVYQRRSMLHVAIADNGSGMPQKVCGGVGLASMRERIEEIGGRMMIRQGKPGTIIIASVPVDAEIRSVGDLAQVS